MNQPETRELVRFLVNCSRTSLGSFLLAKQSRASNLERDLRDVIGNLIETVAFIELANILRNYGEEIVCAVHDRGFAGSSALPALAPAKLKSRALAPIRAREMKQLTESVPHERKARGTTPIWRRAGGGA